MSDKMRMPKIGFGTYGRTGNEGVAALNYALELGYRHIDTAQGYNTEAECGRAVADFGIARNEIFITTKISVENYGKALLVPSLRKSLAALQLDSVDLTLAHWPYPPEDGPIPKAIYLEQLAQAQQQGLTTHIGVSNFTIADIDDAINILGQGAIVNNQFELHPYLQNEKLADHCLANGIQVTCYCPLGQGFVVNDPVLADIGHNHGVTGAQIALAFLMAKGYAVIPTSGKNERIKTNFAAKNVTLTASDIRQIEALDRGHRVIGPPWGPDWDQK